MKYPVLLIADDRQRLPLYSAGLPQAHYMLETTSSLSAALQKIAEIPFPVIISSPGFTRCGMTGGLKILDLVREKQCNTKVIFLADMEDKNFPAPEIIEDQGVFYYLSTPLDLKKLDTAICRAISCWEKEIEECIAMGFLEIDHVSGLFASAETHPGTSSLKTVHNGADTGQESSQDISPPGGKIFLHYGEDDERNAYIIGGILEKNNIPLWKAEKKPGPGDRITTLPREAAQECGIIIILISRAAVESGWINNELADAFLSSVRKDKKRLITILTDETALPRALADTTIVDMKTDPNTKITELTTLIRDILKNQ
jgi:CheY-like chemotaxis protein